MRAGRTPSWLRPLLLAVAGLVVAAGLGIVTAGITSQQVGLSGEPPSVAEELVAGPTPAGRAERQRSRAERRKRRRERRRREEERAEPAPAPPATEATTPAVPEGEGEEIEDEEGEEAFDDD